MVLFVAIVVFFASIAAVAAHQWFGGKPRSWWGADRRRGRAAGVELASSEAAADDPRFAAEAVKAAAADLQRTLVRAWTARDRSTLSRHLGDDLMVEWARRLDDFKRKGWHNVCELREGPRVEYVGLVNRENDADDRVVVRLESELRDVVVDRDGEVITRLGQYSEVVTQAEYWTLGKRDGRWILLSIEQDAEGAHQLEAPIIASPWSDDARLHDEAVTELAVADPVPEDAIADVADLDFDHDARAAALDLTIVDGRFAPALLEASARRAVAAWAEAVDGDDAALEAIASPQAVRELLYPGDPSRTTRLVVRGARLRALRIVALDADARPPTMTVEADLTGHRYREHRDTAAVLDGSKDRVTTFTERWRLALNGDNQTPWHIVSATTAARHRRAH